MIKLYTMEVIGVDTDDEDRKIFTLRTFDAHCATLTMDTLVSPSTVADLCDAIKLAMARIANGS